MARAAALAVTLSVCFVVCAGRLVSAVQNEQQQQERYILLNGGSNAGRHGENRQSTPPVLRVTVWSTSGFFPKTAWDLLSSAVADPLGWVSSGTNLQHLTYQQPMSQLSDAGLDEMLRKISLARMRQALLEYHNFQQADVSSSFGDDGSVADMMTVMGRSQIHLTPRTTTLLTDTNHEDDDRFEQASMASLFDNSLRTGVMDQQLSYEGTEAEGLGALGDSILTVPGLQDLAASSEFTNPSNSRQDNQVSAAGLKHLSAMLHTISGLLLPQNSNHQSKLAAKASSVWDVLGADQDAADAAAYAEEEYDTFQPLNAAAMEPEIVRTFEPFSKEQEQPNDNLEPVLNSEFVYKQPSNTVQEQSWVDALPAYYTYSTDATFADKEDADFDWGLFTFTLLSALCVLVWVVVVRQYVQLRAFWCMQHEQPDSDDDIFAPLLSKIHAVEVAANHVDPSSQSIDTKTALLKAEYCPCF